MAGTDKGFKILVLFEDKGAADFFEQLRPELGLMNVIFEVGGGWTKTYQRYDELALQVESRQIVPVLDADTITNRQPIARTILRNPNLFRFSKDFEWAFEDWMLADAIALFLQSAGARINLRDPEIKIQLEQVVRSARGEAMQTKNPIYPVLKRTFAQWLVRHDIDPTSFPLPDKALLANILGKRLAYLHVLPQEVELAAYRIQQLAGVPCSTERVVWNTNAGGIVENTVRDTKLIGRILLTINGRLNMLHLPTGILTPWGPNKPIYFATWSPDYSKIAAVLVERYPNFKRTKLLILSPEGDVLSEITQGVPTGGPNEPCWHSNGKAIFVKHNGPILLVSENGERWSEVLDGKTGMYCQASSGFCARTVQDRGYKLEMGKSWAKLSPVEGARDVRGWISWSNAGDQLAFTEYHLSNDHGYVAVVNKKYRCVRVITPLAWSPYWVSWSPDDRFVAFSCIEGKEPLRIADVRTGEVRSLFYASGEVVMGCKAWAP